MRYPYARSTKFRYPGAPGAAEEPPWWVRAFGGSSTSTEYDGHRVKVSGDAGVLAYADLEIQLPRGSITAVFRNLVGRIEGRDVEGSLLFDTARGDIVLEGVKGRIKADTGSGDVTASSIEGSFSCDTGSGDCILRRFHGDGVACDVGSGAVRLDSIVATSVDADTGSGNVDARDVDAEQFRADTGSGDVNLVSSGSRLVRVTADTGSGDVTIRLGADASFEVFADQGSGNLVNRFPDAQPIVKGKQVIGYRRGTGDDAHRGGHGKRRHADRAGS